MIVDVWNYLSRINKYTHSKYQIQILVSKLIPKSHSFFGESKAQEMRAFGTNERCLHGVAATYPKIRVFGPVTMKCTLIRVH